MIRARQIFLPLLKELLMRYRSLALIIVLIVATASAGAQRRRTVEESSFATTEVRIQGRDINGMGLISTPEEGPSRITITYGQPHARGRKIIGGLVQYDKVWRFGANLATILRTDVDMTLGGTVIPHGVYSLWALPSKSGWQLIVNQEVGQWGMNYDKSRDVARIPLQSRDLVEPIESFTIYLIPDLKKKGSGTLKIVWEKTELTTDWTVK